MLLPIMEARTKPTAERTAAAMQVSLKPMRLMSAPPTMPPKQKKHIVRVKLRLSAEAVQPNSAARGALRMDQP